MNRAIRLTNLDRPDGRVASFDAAEHGPVRLEVEVGKTTQVLRLSVDVARRLGQSLLQITGNVVELDDGDELEDVEPPPGG